MSFRKSEPSFSKKTYETKYDNNKNVLRPLKTVLWRILLRKQLLS